MSAARSATFLAVLVAAGCTDGRVRLEDDRFGEVRSAVWFQVDVDQDQRFHRFVASNVPGLCDRVAQVVEDLLPVVEEYHASLAAAVTGSDVCVADERFWEKAFQATRRLYRRNGSFLTLTLDDRSGHPDREPGDGTYSSPSLLTPTLSGQLIQMERNPFDRARREGDCRKSDAFGEIFDDLVTRRTLTTGELEVEQRRRELYRIEGEAVLVLPDGRRPMDVDLRGRYHFCALDAPPEVLPHLWFLPLPMAPDAPSDTDLPDDTDSPDDTDAEDAGGEDEG